MKKPIFRVFVSYEIKSKKVVTRKVITGILDTFVLTSNIKEIENDQELIDRICYINKKNLNKVDVIITSIDIENQYGETTDRFEDEYQIMPKIRKIRIEDRKDSRGGGYSRRKFTVAEADAIREEYNTATDKITISSLARKYKVSQPLMYQLIKGKTYTDGVAGGIGGRHRGHRGVQGVWL